MNIQAVEPLWTVAHVARETGLPTHFLRRLIKKGRVKSVSIAGTIRVRLSDVLAEIEERGPSSSGR